MSNEFNAMSRNEVAVLYSVMGFAQDNMAKFDRAWNLTEDEWTSFRTLFSELCDAAVHHGIQK